MRMWQLHYISKADELTADKAPLGLKMSSAPAGSRLRQPAGRAVSVLL